MVYLYKKIESPKEIVGEYIYFFLKIMSLRISSILSASYPDKGRRTFYLTKNQITDFSNANAYGIPVYYDHNMDRQIGYVEGLYIRNNYLAGDIIITEPIYIEKILSREITGASVGLSHTLSDKRIDDLDVIHISSKALTEVSITSDPELPEAKIFSIHKTDFPTKKMITTFSANRGKKLRVFKYNRFPMGVIIKKTFASRVCVTFGYKKKFFSL